MSAKKVLVVILLAVSFCFVSGAGYGEIEEWLLEVKAIILDFELLNVRVNYIMANPDDFLRVSYVYDKLGSFAEYFPAGIETKGKIFITIIDSRNVFSGKPGIIMLLSEFKIQLFSARYFLNYIVNDLDHDVVARFCNEWGKPLGYFYQGEYHLWEK